MKKKHWIIILLLAVVLVVAWYRSSTQWTRDFEIRYVEYVSKSIFDEGPDNSYYLYEITNNTNRTLRNVSVVILVDRVGGDFEYTDRVTQSIKPGETIEYRLYTKDYQAVAEERGIELGFLSVSSVDIVEIKYTK